MLDFCTTNLVYLENLITFINCLKYKAVALFKVTRGLYCIKAPAV